MWDDVEVAVKAVGVAYQAMLDARAEHRSDSKLVIQAEDEWLDALTARAEALRAHWDEDLDGHTISGYEPSLASTLRRYYQETYKATKGVKRG